MRFESAGDLAPLVKAIKERTKESFNTITRAYRCKSKSVKFSDYDGDYACAYTTAKYPDKTQTIKVAELLRSARTEMRNVRNNLENLVVKPCTDLTFNHALQEEMYLAKLAAEAADILAREVALKKKKQLADEAKKSKPVASKAKKLDSTERQFIEGLFDSSAAVDHSEVANFSPEQYERENDVHQLSSGLAAHVRKSAPLKTKSVSISEPARGVSVDNGEDEVCFLTVIFSPVFN